MCGIFAYNGKNNAVPLLIEGLRNLEYRGYDSAGVVSVNTKGEFFLEKATGKVSMLATKVEKRKRELQKENIKEKFRSGIAHTRWATHGGVTEKNTHPHYSSNKRFYVVHNGIIENYMELKGILQKKGHIFYSETDTEVIAKLIEDVFDGDLLSTIEKVTQQLVGAYSLASIDIENPDTLIGTKLGSPMIVGIGKSETFLSSDINAVSNYAHEFISLEDYEIVKIENGKHHIFSMGKEIDKECEKMTQEFQTATKGDFETFTEKEIHEVPEVLENVFKGRINFETQTIQSETLDKLNTYNIEKIEIIASGSSYFAGVVGSYWFKELSGLPCEVRISSEFLYDTFLPQEKTLYIFMSQSGETADVRESVKIVKAKGGLTFGVINVVGSTIARMCDMGLYTHSGIEIGVASTKNIIGQLGTLLLMALNFGAKKNLQMKHIRDIITKLGDLPKKLQSQLQSQKAIQPIIKKYSLYSHFFFLGRNVLYGTASESALKFKELTYLHAECYSTGELKHGPLALVGPDFPCVVINPTGPLQLKTLSNIKEVRARNTTVLGIISEGESGEDLYDDVIEVPHCDPILSPFIALIPTWLLAVGVAKELGRDVDKPQNLAKSVTVE